MKSKGGGKGGREAELCVICLSLMAEQGLSHVVCLLPEAVIIQNYLGSVCV